MRSLLVLALVACAAGGGEGPGASAATESAESGTSSEFADVVSVEAVREVGGYRFAVGLASPDVGCEQYADWWEVVSEDGELIYRRPLGHSHVDEQPFVRSGGPVEIEADTQVWIRGHMHPTGYGGVAFFGSVEGGFSTKRPPASFAAELAEAPPTAPECRW